MDLYNNAGIEGKQAGMTEYDVNIFKKVIDINLMGVYYGMRYVIPVMQKQKYGRIVNVASVRRYPWGFKSNSLCCQ